jgi:hypothetical protein
MNTAAKDTSIEEPARSRKTTYALVILVEIATVAALWLFGRHFS